MGIVLMAMQATAVPPLLQIIVVLLVLALAWWIFSTYVLPHVVEPFRTIIIVILALFVIVWLLSLVGLIGPLRLW
jgi:hypothetical protein